MRASGRVESLQSSHHFVFLANLGLGRLALSLWQSGCRRTHACTTKELQVVFIRHLLHQIVHLIFCNKIIITVRVNTATTRWTRAPCHCCRTWSNTAQHNTEHNTTPHSTPRHSTTPYSTTHHDTTRHDTTRHDTMHTSPLVRQTHWRPLKATQNSVVHAQIGAHNVGNQPQHRV